MSLSVDIQRKLGAFDLQVSFDAGAETLGLLGASGCGKTLTMRSIAGIETPDAGKIVVDGTVFFDKASGRRARVNLTPQQRKTALLFQNYMLFPNLTVAQNVAAGIGRDVPAAERDAAVTRELHRFGLSGFERRYPAQLSGGQQQRVALARMLAARPSILMLDEPFSALDAHLKGVLEQNLVSLFDAFSGTVLYVSHDIDEALRFCDRIAVVDDPQSEAGIKLSGCKNCTPAVRAGEREVFLPKWGVAVRTGKPVPENVRYLGVRARYIVRADGPGENCFRMRVDRASDSRFERSLLLAFLDRCDDETAEGSAAEDEMHFLHRHLFWRVGTVDVAESQLPHVGDELWVRIDPQRLYLVTK